jgi:hypothetical protein
MKTNKTPQAMHKQDFDATGGDRGPWANAWHPSWGENEPDAKKGTSEDAQELSPDDEDSRDTNSPSS